VLHLIGVWRVFGDPGGWAVWFVPFARHFRGMKENSLTLPFPKVWLTSVTLIGNVWGCVGDKDRHCGGMPAMSGRLSARHSSYRRRFWDLTIETSTDHAHRWPMAMSQRHLRAVHLHRSTAWDGGAPRSRQTRRAAGILRLLGHSVGGRPGEKLAAPLGFVGNRTTILRHLMRRQLPPDHSALRVVGLDEWASRKGFRFGTIAVDLSDSDRHPARSLGCQHCGVVGRATQHRADRP
jgi:hypothetical protein